MAIKVVIANFSRATDLTRKPSSAHDSKEQPSHRDSIIGNASGIDITNVPGSTVYQETVRCMRYLKTFSTAKHFSKQSSTLATLPKASVGIKCLVLWVFLYKENTCTKVSAPSELIYWYRLKRSDLGKGI